MRHVGIVIMLAGATACGSVAPKPTHERAVVIRIDDEMPCAQACARVVRPNERVVDCLWVTMDRDAQAPYEREGNTACMVDRSLPP